ncbi:hypothetical protein D1872_276640 [compost metagenome]
MPNGKLGNDDAQRGKHFFTAPHQSHHLGLEQGQGDGSIRYGLKFGSQLMGRFNELVFIISVHARYLELDPERHFSGTDAHLHEIFVFRRPLP